MSFKLLTDEEERAIDAFFALDESIEPDIIEDTTISDASAKKKRSILATVKEVFRPKRNMIDDFFDNLE